MADEKEEGQEGAANGAAGPTPGGDTAPDMEACIADKVGFTGDVSADDAAADTDSLHRPVGEHVCGLHLRPHRTRRGGSIHRHTRPVAAPKLGLDTNASDSAAWEHCRRRQFLRCTRTPFRVCPAAPNPSRRHCHHDAFVCSPSFLPMF